MNVLLHKVKSWVEKIWLHFLAKIIFVTKIKTILKNIKIFAKLHKLAQCLPFFLFALAVPCSRAAYIG